MVVGFGAVWCVDGCVDTLARSHGPLGSSGGSACVVCVMPFRTTPHFSLPGQIGVMDDERRALRSAFWLNVCLAAGLMVTGVIGDSSGLIADALDNTSDAAFYAISYYAVTRGAQWKTRAAQMSL